jgi:tRNA(Ile)-lysidine synthase
VRGAGGIRPRRGILIRPLLDTRRAALRAELVTRGEAWCEDSSNADRAIPRNAIRHDLLPVIERLAPGGIAALARFAALAQDDEAEIDKRAIEVASGIVLLEDGRVRIGRRALAALSPAVARRVVRRALEHVSPPSVSARSIDVIRKLAAADTSKRHVDVTGLAIDITGADLWIAPGGGRSGRTSPDGDERVLAVPGSVDVAEAGARVTAERADGIQFERWPNGRGPIVAVQASSIKGALRVRSRRPGDRLRPLGAPGRRKVQDLLVDRKVPRAERDRVPIVVDETGQIVWVAGHALADQCRVTAPECGVVLLKIIDL